MFASRAHEGFYSLPLDGWGSRHRKRRNVSDRNCPERSSASFRAVVTSLGAPEALE
jgi:hypothetical protein